MNVLKKWRIILLIIVVSLLIYAVNVKVFTHKKINNSNPITITINKVKGGYNYVLSSNNKILIKQKYIPAISEKRVFCNAEDAKIIANLVKRKITTKKNPTVSLEELKNLNINFNCVGLH